MATHIVTIDTPQLEVGKKDIIFKIWENDKFFGHLKISRGAVIWQPTKKSKAYRLTWKQLDALSRVGKRGKFPI